MRTALTPQAAATLAAVTARRDDTAVGAADARREWERTIATLRTGGATLTALARATGLSRQRIHQVASRAQA